ncbi:conserved hypothetical protein [Ricinus communis]|uniref:Uncharacterized protein n=1 Tax=Ricinus communis TaxID=3988 RepID=B9S6A9_RICCO|nr:conserved hypothetical protein [Ricinus communis]
MQLSSYPIKDGIPCLVSMDSKELLLLGLFDCGKLFFPSEEDFVFSSFKYICKELYISGVIRMCDPVQVASCAMAFAEREIATFSKQRTLSEHKFKVRIIAHILCPPIP